MEGNHNFKLWGKCSLLILNKQANKKQTKKTKQNKTTKKKGKKFPLYTTVT